MGTNVNQVQVTILSLDSLLPRACSSYAFLQYLEPLPTLWLSSPANDNNNNVPKFSSFGRGKKNPEDSIAVEIAAI